MEKYLISGNENITYICKNTSFIIDRKLSTNYYSKTNNKDTINTRMERVCNAGKKKD